MTDIQTVLDIDDLQKQSFLDLMQKSSLLKKVVEVQQRNDKNGAGLMIDVYEKLFNPDLKIPIRVVPGLEEHHEFLDQMETSKEYRELKDITANNIFASALATAQLVQHIQQHNVDEIAKPEDLRDAIRDGLKEVIVMVRQTESDIAAFSNALGDYDGKITNASVKFKYMEILQRSNKMKNVATILGRLKKIAAHKQRTKIKHGSDEIVSIGIGDELERIVPSELAMLADPELEDIFSVNYIEKAVVQYEMSGVDTMGKGPIVVMVDNSGSMAGERECWSKAIMLAMASIAKKQKRTFAVIYFDSKICGGFPKVYPDGDISVEEMTLLVEYFSGGGTDFEDPISAAMKIVNEDAVFDKADLLMITDGYCSILGKFEENFMEWKKQSESCMYTVAMVHRIDYNTPITRMSDGNFNYLDLQSDEEGVGRQIEDKVLAI